MELHSQSLSPSSSSSSFVAFAFSLFFTSPLFVSAPDPADTTSYPSLLALEPVNDGELTSDSG